nr:hypothetical protein Iba_chr09dCG13100 [Ipomoea batatas]
MEGIAHAQKSLSICIFDTDYQAAARPLPSLSCVFLHPAACNEWSSDWHPLSSTITVQPTAASFALPPAATKQRASAMAVSFSSVSNIAAARTGSGSSRLRQR